jgi:hypothetical protein
MESRQKCTSPDNTVNLTLLNQLLIMVTIMVLLHQIKGRPKSPFLV